MLSNPNDGNSIAPKLQSNVVREVVLENHDWKVFYVPVFNSLIHRKISLTFCDDYEALKKQRRPIATLFYTFSTCFASSLETKLILDSGNVF